jgi:hypothetical protein
MKKILRRAIGKLTKNKRKVSSTRLFQQADTYPMYEKLLKLMQNFTVSQLANTASKAFKQSIDEFLELNDAQMEGYDGSSKQRDLYIKFHWGHNHDFGDFRLDGRMGNRHIELITMFMIGFDLSPQSFAGLRVLDMLPAGLARPDIR